MSTSKHVLGFDIGGTKIEGSLIDESGQILKTTRFPALLENEPMLARITSMVQDLSVGFAPSAVGFSMPGSLDHCGILRNAPNSPAIEGTPLAADLQARIGLPLFFENDANCLAISEHAFGAARGFDHVVGIILGTGVGGGVILNGKVLHGWRGLAPEPGHLPIDIHGRQCLCGNRGCVEAYLSGPSVLRRYHDAGGSKSVLDTRTIFESQSTDPLAANIVEETLEIFARFMATLISLYDPQVFVLGGGLSLQEAFYEQESRIGRFVFGTKELPKILPAEHGDTSGKLGAAALALADG